MRYYDYPTKEREDVHIELVDLEKVKYGDVFKGRVHLEVWYIRIITPWIWQDNVSEYFEYLNLIKTSLHFQNKSNQPRTLNCRFTCNSIYYTGIIANLIKHAKGEFTLQAGESNTLFQMHKQSKIIFQYFTCFFTIVDF